MKQLFLILAFVLYIPLQVAGQVHYPIRTTTVVTPPVPFSLDGFVSQPGKLMLNIMVDDVTLSQYPVKLLLHIEGNGIRISTNPNLALQPVYIDGGMVTQLTGPDLEAYFNPENLIFQGYSLSEYRRNGRLPEGVYRIRFEVLDYYRGFQISSAIPAVAMLSLTNAPVLTYPVNRSEVDVDANPVFRFSWMAVFTAIPEAMIEYRFRLWLIRPDNRDPYEITRVTTPIYDEIVTETALLYDGSLPPLIRSSRYVWQVTAIDRVGKVLFKNNGDSDIFTFRYGCKCEAPSALISKVSHNSVSVSWNSNPSVNEYIVNYRAENASEWNKVSTRTIGYTIDNLKHSTNYEVQVKANCGEETSDNERVLHFKTDRFVDYTCGAGAPVFSFDNREPLPMLNKYDEFKASDFYIEVTEVRGANGIFSGRGLASVPLLNFLKFEVAFNDITINTDRQMIDGKVVFVYDEATGMIIGGDMGYGKSESDDEKDTEAYNYEEALDYISDQTVSLDEEIKEVTVNNGVVKVVTESGQTKTYKVGENETLAVVTPEGVTVVDQASGRVFQTTKESPGSSSGVRTSSQSGIHGCMVDFRPIEGQRFGFDAVGNGIVKPDNYFLRDRDGSSIPWKSLEAGNTDRVSMLSTGDCSSDSLRFIRESGILTPTTPGKNNSIELLLTGGFAGQEERLTVARATTKHINDSTTNEILTEAGVLGLVTYSREIKNVVLVPVNSSSFPSAGADLSVVAKRLNEIYSPAVVNWHVSYDHAIEVGKVNEEDFKVEGTSMLSKYTPDMNKVIRKYKRERPTDDNTMYLFFLNIPDLGSNRKGFMPLAGNYGFIFNFGTDLELLAHELAHGAFNLRHTFSDKAQYYFPQNQTANLLDYAGGTELWKYQWDLIHNPESILFAWAQDEEEGAAINLDLIISNAQESGIEFDGSEIITCITPAGKPYTLPSNIKSLDFTSDNEDFPDGALLNFTTTDGKTFVAVYKRSNKEFLGYTELINPNATDKKEKINYKDDAKKIPDCRLDNTTKTLTDQSRVLLGKKIDCAINVYQVEYSEVANKTGVSEEGYCGSGTYSSEPLAYNVEGKTPITVGDNSACLNKYAKEFYQGHLTASSAYKETLLRIANLLSSIEGGGDAMFTDYEKYCNKENSRRYYGNPDLWGTPEDYQLFEKALEAYINKKETLEQLILAENDRDKLTDLAWLLVDKWSESISYDVRLHVIKKLSEGAMYGNDLFGNGQEYLAIRLIYGITDVQEQAKFLTDITKDGLLETLFSRMGDEGGDDNFTTFIMLLSQMAKNNTETFGIQGDPMFIWVGDLFRSDKVKINFTTDGQVKLQGFIKEYTCYPTYYGGGSSCTSTWKSTTDEYTLSPFTFIPVKFPKGEKFLESLSDDGSNITFVPVIYLKALNAKRNTDVTKTTVGVAVDVASLCIGIGELNMAIKAVKGGATAIKILRLTALATDVIITSSDVIVTLVEDDIKELDGGQEFLDKYRIYSALIGLTAFGADNLTKSPETLAGLSDSWRKFKGKYGSDPKKVINAVGGPERYNKIENIVDNTEDALRQTEHADLVSKTPDLDANYVEAIADIANDWKKNALGQQIEELTDAPLGYQFYRRDGNKWIRRLDADNPKTPRLTVENGKIVMYDLLQNADEVKDLLKTNANTAFFWSGRTNGIGGEVRALKVAKSKGGTTLEGLLADKGIKMPAWSDNPGIWDDVSAEYANQVSGEVRAVVGKELRPDNVWENIELPRLKTNTKVTKITTIDPETLEETVIFTR